MEALSAADLLDVWEQGASAGAHERALLLLAHARPEVPAGALGAVPLGSRDADLLRLRQATFGRRVAAVMSCPACDERLDVEVDAAALVTEPGDGAARVAVGGRELTIRSPTTDDLIAARDEAASRPGSTGRLPGACSWRDWSTMRWRRRQRRSSCRRASR